ncbi:MAG: hypothetical protein RL227_567 [Pseudomonadota bacterium]|jgi:hypothetical protein
MSLHDRNPAALGAACEDLVPLVHLADLRTLVRPVVAAFLATSGAYLRAPIAVPAAAPPVLLRRGPSSAVLRKQQRAARGSGPRG